MGVVIERTLYTTRTRPRRDLSVTWPSQGSFPRSHPSAREPALHDASYSPTWIGIYKPDSASKCAEFLWEACSLDRTGSQAEGFLRTAASRGYAPPQPSHSHFSTGGTGGRPRGTGWGSGHRAPRGGRRVASRKLTEDDCSGGHCDGSGDRLVLWAERSWEEDLLSKRSGETLDSTILSPLRPPFASSGRVSSGSNHQRCPRSVSGSSTS